MENKLIEILPNNKFILNLFIVFNMLILMLFSMTGMLFYYQQLIPGYVLFGMALFFVCFQFNIYRKLMA